MAKVDVRAFIDQLDWPRLLAGGALCLFGWTLYWFCARAVGLILGGAAGCVVGLGIAYAGDWLARALAPAVAGIVLAGAIGGAIGLFAIKRVHRLAFFVIGSLLGAALAWVFLPDAERLDAFRQYPQLAPLIYYSAAPLIAGALTACLARYVIVIATSAAGAALVVQSCHPARPALVFAPLLCISLAFQSGMVQQFVSVGERVVGESWDDDSPRIKERG